MIRWAAECTVRIETGCCGVRGRCRFVLGGARRAGRRGGDRRRPSARFASSRFPGVRLRTGLRLSERDDFGRRRGDRCLDRQRSPSAGDRCALYGRSGEARRRTENSRRLYGRRLCRDPAFLPHAALGGADSAAQKAVTGCPHFRTAVFQQVNQKIFCSSSSSAQPSGVRRHSRLRPHSTNPARRNFLMKRFRNFTKGIFRFGRTVSHAVADGLSADGGCGAAAN